MIVEIIIVALIVLYAGYVIYKKVKDMKKENFCNCGGEECPSTSKCHKK